MTYIPVEPEPDNFTTNLATLLSLRATPEYPVRARVCAVCVCVCVCCVTDVCVFTSTQGTVGNQHVTTVDDVTSMLMTSSCAMLSS